MKTIRIGHSPDPDDAFMFYAFAAGEVELEGYVVEQVLEDIDSLNHRAQGGDLEVTAISAGAYPNVSDKYQIMPCGASVGRRYGPILVSNRPFSVNELAGKRVGIPGQFTTAYLLLRIYLNVPFEPIMLEFDGIGDAIQRGEVDAGVIIHEGQLTWMDQGFVNLMDLGEMWFEDTGLPIPLGLDVVSRALSPVTRSIIVNALDASIRFALANEDAAIDYALPFGRGIERDQCRQFVRMYVNDDTVNMGTEGVKALDTLYHKAHARELIGSLPPLDIIGM